jgi:hypothetical protein
VYGKKEGEEWERKEERQRNDEKGECRAMFDRCQTFMQLIKVKRGFKEARIAMIHKVLKRGGL